MAWTTITKPTQGAATKKSLIDAIIDNLTYLFSQASTSALIANGSFEDDGDGDGTPDSWTLTLFTGGSFTLDSTDQRHGAKSAKFTSPGGASNGGGFLHSNDFFAVSPNRQVEVLWELKASAAGVSNRVELYWYKADQTASATPSTSLYNSTSNPTSWTAMANFATPPSDARYAKLRITGCHTASTTAGSTWFDNLQVRLRQTTIPVLEIISASTTWTVPAGVHRLRVRAWGAGGGGFGSGASNGAGGGGGGFGEVLTDVVPGTAYTVTIGAGGAIGAAGGDTSFGALITCNGGAAATSTTGGAGGAGGGSWSITGQNGGDYAHGSEGGASPNGGPGGRKAGAAGTNGIVPGGGGGGTDSGSSAGTGADGRIALEY